MTKFNLFNVFEFYDVIGTLYLKWAKPGLFFVYLCSFFKNTEITEDFSKIRTWIVELEGEHADHKTHGPS